MLSRLILQLNYHNVMKECCKLNLLYFFSLLGNALMRISIFLLVAFVLLPYIPILSNLLYISQHVFIQFFSFLMQLSFLVQFSPSMQSPNQSVNSLEPEIVQLLKSYSPKSAKKLDQDY